jgi:ABC-2 type transport system ATP-binding protein
MIGIVFQDPTLDEYLTAEQNLYYHCMIYHTLSKTRDTRIRDVLQLVGLDERRKDIVKTFSGGMKHRLEVARGLLHEPQTLFLDEPTVGRLPGSIALWHGRGLGHPEYPATIDQKPL